MSEGVPKFRAKTIWDLSGVGGDKPLKKGEWYYFTLTEIWGKEMADFIDWSTLAQFTTLHDKNGKEIYEGDIRRFKDEDGKIFAYVVKFKDGCFGSDEEWVQCGKGFKYRFKTQWSDIKNSAHKSEVIANIYEHPELLKGGK